MFAELGKLSDKDLKQEGLSKEELEWIYTWESYRDDWPVNRNGTDDHIQIRHGKLIRALNMKDLPQLYDKDASAPFAAPVQVRKCPWSHFPAPGTWYFACLSVRVSTSVAFRKSRRLLRQVHDCR